GLFDIRHSTLAMLTLDGTPEAKPSLYIIDALNFLFRALHALPPLKTTKGMQTGAIYGLCQMILRIEREQKPTHLCVVYDAPGDNFRNELYDQSNAHRAPHPPARLCLSAAQSPPARRCRPSWRISWRWCAPWSRRSASPSWRSAA